MDSKKLSFSDQFPYCASPRSKVVSGFGLGVLASLIALTLVFFNPSFKSPFFTPIFQGFNTFRLNNTPIVSWPLSFSTTSSSSSSFSSSSSSSSSNVPAISEKGNVLGSSGEQISLEETHVENFSEKVKNGSLNLEEEKTQFGNGSSDMGQNANFTKSEGEDALLEGNGSFRVENGSSVNNPVGFTENSKIGKRNASGNVNVRFTGKEVWSSDVQNQRVSSEDNKINVSSTKCDFFDGRWVRDYTKPYYPPGSCPYIDRDFDCHFNRRPDDGFLKWKWKPYGCEIPSLNAIDFLERLRGKKLVFVGDSLNRNMWESLVCILHHSVRNKKRVYEISGRTDFKKKGFYAFRFEDYNCSVDFVSSPFLVRESSFNGRNDSFETLRLDLMDQTTSMYHDADVVVFNTGHWWTHEKTSKGEDYYQEGNHVYPRLKVLTAYTKALTTWARWVDKIVDGSRTQVIFRGYSVTHFSGGRWNSGGQCQKETEPIFNETYLANYPSKMRALENVIREMKTPVIYLNISRLTDYRKDGHPSIYRKKYKTVEEQIAAEQSQDCSHWCLPGVPDTWNELLYASLLESGQGSWKK